MEDQRGVVIDDATRTILLVGGQRAAADPAEAGKADRPIRKRLRDPLLHVLFHLRRARATLAGAEQAEAQNEEEAEAIRRAWHQHGPLRSRTTEA